MPTGHDTTESRSDAKDLLLEDYRYLGDSFWKNEQTGETRVNWFIGIVTAVSGGLVTLASAEHGPRGEPLRLIIIAFLSALLVFGIVTLLRIIKRNETTDGYKQDMDSVRQIFKDQFDSDHILLRYQPFGSKAQAAKAKEPPKSPDGAGEQSKKDIGRKLGGLAHTVSAINSLLAGGLAGAIVFPVPGQVAGGGVGAPTVNLGWTYGLALLAFALAFGLQLVFVDSREAKARKQRAAGNTTHAGGIVYGMDNGVVKYLLVGPKVDRPEEWLLPKGHVENGEEHGEAALREVQEEAGVAARLLNLVGSVEFATSKEPVRAKYYLMERLFETPRPESRRFGWFVFDEALMKLNHDQNKRLLHEAERRRRAKQ